MLSHFSRFKIHIKFDCGLTGLFPYSNKMAPTQIGELLLHTSETDSSNKRNKFQHREYMTA